MAAPDGYLCDTIPPPQNLSLNPNPPTPVPSARPRSYVHIPDISKHHAPVPLTLTPARKLCVRHQRMADEGISLKMQQSLDALPLKDREAVNTIWSNFSSSPHPRRALILQGLLTMCCFSQLSLLTEQLQHLIRLDPFHVLPREVSLKVLQSLDAISLGRAAQVSKHWRSLADDDILWKNICEQHIDKKCPKCGWGLPLLEKRRPPLSPAPTHCNLSSKRDRDNDLSGLLLDSHPVKRHKPESALTLALGLNLAETLPPGISDDGDADFTPRTMSPLPVTRPWKDVYCERLTIERNWRRGRCTVRTLQGHTDGVMCMQFSETLTHPAFPILITGSYDRTARVWNLETGREVRRLTGHTRAVRALQFDEVKLITGSMDRQLRIWDWRTGRCIRTLEGHAEGVVSLNFDADVLASGSVDTTVKVWDFRTGERFTLRGHRDWVNAVMLWNRSDVQPDDAPTPTEDHTLGKMLFSASDDGDIRLWNLAHRECIRQFTGHVGQVQSIRLVTLDPNADGNELLAPSPEDIEEDEQHMLRPPHGDPRSTLPSGLPSWAPASLSIPTMLPANHPDFDAPAFETPSGFDPIAYRTNPDAAPTTCAFPHADSELRKGKQRSRSTSPTQKRQATPVLVSGSLDNTIKVWDVESGKTIKTLFGHIEGVWAIACDKLRMVSGSHDRTIKVWVREEGRCMATLVGHRGAVTCLALGDDKIISGSDDGDVKIWSFSPP